MDRIIDVAKDFSPRLANREKYNGDGTFTAVEFRRKYLNPLKKSKHWKNDETFITFDFNGVERLSPGFANEAFGYFTAMGTPRQVLKKIRFINISDVKIETIHKELKAAYYV